MKENNQILLNKNWALSTKIGSGAFGTIRIAASIHTKKLVAVKIEDTRKSELLAGEAMIVKSLNRGIEL